MDHVADSDTENSLPLLCVSDVDTASVRSVFALFSHDTRCRLRAEAHNTPFAALYEEHPPDLTQNGSLDYADPPDPQAHTQEHTPTSALSPEPVLAEPWREPDTHIPPTTSQPQTIHVLSSQAAPADISLAKPTQNSGGRASRSLRKRTFASRHPYIADQADWLGICTVESINEMFDGDEEISRVVRALNHLYLQKKKRYPDEDRYRSKDFYTHLGHSKSLALQGDADAVEDENGDLRQIQHQDSASQDEHNYDPDAHSSQIDHSADDEDEDDEDRLIPYDEFAYPYSQDPVSPSQTEIASETFKHPNDHNGLHGTPQFQEYNDSSEDDSAEDAPDSPQQEEEEYIKIGGKYRKLRTILRGVLPESAKRLGIFERKSPVKRRKKITRTLTPRKGLAMKKHGSSVSNSAELERELFSRAPQDPGEAPLRRSSVQPTISESSILRFERPTSSRPVPSLSRNSTSFTYISDTPEPQYIDSCSDSETEGLGVETLGQGRISTLSNPPSLSLSRSSTLGLSHSPHSSYPQSHNNPSDINNQWRIPLDEPFDQGYAQEFDEIDHLLAPRGNKPGRTVKGLSSQWLQWLPMDSAPTAPVDTFQKGALRWPQPRKSPHIEERKNSGLSQRRLNLPKVPIGRPAATQQRRQRNGASNPRRSQVLEKIQTRLPAFRDSLRQEKACFWKNARLHPRDQSHNKAKIQAYPSLKYSQSKDPGEDPGEEGCPLPAIFQAGPNSQHLGH
ncbi:hypothetical protein JCM33374_g3543 [Metschnikowia sp. JCM 33374]|nr:hypothetical protein JCM33374_g3543 [Metschnikowia sp. JCM 33374]